MPNLLDKVWIVPAIMGASFLLILFFGKRAGTKATAGIGIAAWFMWARGLWPSAIITAASSSRTSKPAPMSFTQPGTPVAGFAFAIRVASKHIECDGSIHSVSIMVNPSRKPHAEALD